MSRQPQAASISEPAREAPFTSILYPGEATDGVHAHVPSATCLRDLGLDRILDGAASSPEIRTLFAMPLRDADAIRFRQEVMRELESAALQEAITSFRADLHAARVRLEGDREAGFPYARERAVLDAAVRYVRAVSRLAATLDGSSLTSRGLARLRQHLSRTVASAAFRSLADDSTRAASQLNALRYTLLIEGRSVTVAPFREADDLREEVVRLFGRFMQRPAPEVEVRPYLPAARSGVQAQVLRRLAALNPQPFEGLTRFATRHVDFVDPVLERVARELAFYLDYLRYIAPLREAGLAFCYPSMAGREVRCLGRDVFDLALAQRLVGKHQAVVPNDIELRGRERIVVVTGPNQGGKTTYARTYGQLHYLASLGFPVPGSEARLTPFDRLLTHFERGEAAQDLRGKLVDELTRLRDLLEVVTPETIVILNETFSSTTLADASFLGAKLLGRLSQLDLRAVFVTFVDALATFDAKTVSVVSTVDPDDPSIRTFRLLRRPADGAAHALTIARKHGVTFEQILERLSA